jgi:NifU-like protein involved in Fe-S cluster formation
MAAIAASNALCEAAKGKKINKALKIKYEDIIKKLGGMPNIKIHCSILGTDALKKAIENYRMKKED